MKKTIKIEDLKARANEYFSLSADSANRSRMAVQMFVETILIDSKQYRGFNYVHWESGGYDQWVKDGRPDFPEKSKYFGDESRIFFY